MDKGLLPPQTAVLLPHSHHCQPLLQDRPGPGEHSQPSVHRCFWATLGAPLLLSRASTDGLTRRPTGCLHACSCSRVGCRHAAHRQRELACPEESVRVGARASEHRGQPVRHRGEGASGQVLGAPGKGSAVGRS